MKKIVFVVLSCLVVMALTVSCATPTQSRRDYLRHSVLKSGNMMLGADGSEVPDWILSDVPSYETATIVAYGNSKNEEKAMEAAMANARDELKTWFSNKVSNITFEFTRRYTDEIGNKNGVFADDFARIAYRSFNNNFAENFTVEASWRDSDNGQWLLVGIPLPELRDMLYETADTTPMDPSVVTRQTRLKFIYGLIDDQFPAEPFTDGDVVL